MARMIRGAALAVMLAVQAVPALADRAEDAVASNKRTEADRGLDEGRHPVEVLRFADVKPGEVVADFMAGGGYYSALLAELVGPRGTVYAINPVSFHPAKDWAQRATVYNNIRTMTVAPDAMLLAPGSVDMMFAHLTFHDLYWESAQYAFPRLDVDFVLANWFAAVRPGGHVLIVDHVGPEGDPREVTERLHRIAPATIVTAMERAGFVLEEQSDMLRRSTDDLSKNVFDAAVRGKTDRIVMKFQQTAA